MSAPSHIAIPRPEFSRVLELLALALDLVELIGIEGVPFDAPRAEKLQQAVFNARAEALVIAEQARECQYVDLRRDTNRTLH